MNEYRRFVQNELDRRNWKPADVEKHGGPSRQVMSTILNDKRQVLEYRPKQETIEKLAAAFGISEDVILAHVAMAMELPVTIQAASLDDVSDDDLLDQLRKRLKREGNEHGTGNQQQGSGSSTVVEGNFRGEDAEPEQKIAAYDRDLGDGIQAGDIPENS